MQVKEVNSLSHPAATVAGEDLELLQEETSDSGDLLPTAAYTSCLSEGKKLHEYLSRQPSYVHPLI